MDTYFNNDGIVKASASESQKKVDQSQSYSGISSEPLQKYIDEFREELHMEMAGISEIKW